MCKIMTITNYNILRNSLQMICYELLNNVHKIRIVLSTYENLNHHDVNNLA